MMLEKIMLLGLKEKEAKIFLIVLENRKLSASAISRLGNMKRTTAYTIAEELVQKGILDKDVTKTTTYYSAFSPNSLINYVSQQKRILTERELVLNSLLPELTSLPKSRRFTIPKVRFVEGDEIEPFLYKQIDEWVKSTLECKDKTHYCITGPNFEAIPKYKKWIEWSWRRMPKEINLKLFLHMPKGQGLLSDLKMPRCKTKLWDSEPLSAGQWLMGSYIVHCVVDHAPHHLIQIYDPTLADSLRKMYRELWKLK